MGFSGFINVVILILMLSSFVKTLMADPRADIAALVCNSSTALSSTLYAQNFISLMTNLSSQVNQNGFGKFSVGEGPNGVFGLAQCYKDLNSSDCILCFSKIRSVLPTCYRIGIGGRLFLDGCFGRYENYSFFDQGIDSIVVKNCSYSKNNSQADKFGELLRKVVENVSLRAAQISSNGFAVGSESVSNFSVYALAQCWDSLDVKTCNSCLQASASELISCSPAVEGRSLNAGCYMRYSNKIIWNSDQSTEGSPGNHHKSLWIILGSVIGGCLLILTGIFVWKGKGCLGRSHDAYGSRLSVAISYSRINFRYQELRSATNGFDISNKLGQGSYGTVYKGILPDGKEVAVKRLFLNTREWAAQFLNEVNLINQVRHKNLVKLLGCSVDGPESLLVFEYYYNKSLDHFIFDKDQANVLDWQKRFDIVQGVAEGLAYLHQESETRIIHRDIKASNILLNDKFRPKITDFGLARSFMEDQTHLSTGIAGTIGYMAPEYAIHGHLTDKADVYSFGVLVLEIVTGQRCSKSVGAKLGQHFLAMIWSHYKAKTFNKIINRSFYEEALEDEILHVVHVGLMCTQATPYYRPTMAKVVELLRSNRDHQGDVFPTDPPFLDFLASTTNTSQEEGEESTHVRVSVASDPSFSGSSGSLLSER